MSTRTELDALIVLSERHGNQNPLLAYVVGKMKDPDIPLCPQPFRDPERAVKLAIKELLKAAIEDYLEEVVDDATGHVNDFKEELPSVGEGKPVDLMRTGKGPGEKVDLEPLRKPLTQIARSELEDLGWLRRTEYERRKVIQQAGEKDVKKILKMIRE